MPYAPQAPTPELILSRMTPGKTYVTYLLAATMKVKSGEIRDLLAAMVADGRLGRVKPPGASNARFFIAGTYTPPVLVAPAPEVDPATIAGRRAPPPLNCNIRGYDAEIAQRVALCMLTRGRA